MNDRTTLVRAVTSTALALALLGSGATVQAQSDATPLSPAQSLACLQKTAEAPKFPEKHKYDRGYGFMRVLIRFEKPDAAPVVEVLSNTAREDMQDEVFRYVRGFRLPCLGAEDGKVQAVQEFSFSNTPQEPLPMAPRRAGEFCIVMPRTDIDPPFMTPGSDVEHVVAVAVFSGDGQQPPEVKLIHSTASKRTEQLVRERVAQYRMPCRNGTGEPQAMRQTFSFNPPAKRRYVLHKEVFGLVEYLRLTRDAHKLEVRFDFNTMSCPFKVNLSLYGPALPNEAFAGKPDPNRLAFLRWLAKLPLSYANEKQANELFGSSVQIDVPCGVLDLKPKQTDSQTRAD